MARIAHLSDLHFGAHDPAVGGGRRGVARRRAAGSGRDQRRFHPAGAGRAVREAGAFLGRLDAAGLSDAERAGQSRRAALRRVPALRPAAPPLPPPYRRRSLPLVRERAAGRARHQHGALADLQGRADQPRPDGAHPRPLPRRRRRSGPGSSSPTTPCSKCRSATKARRPRRSGGMARRSRRWPMRASIILLAGHFHRSFTASARKMVKNAGPALVIQAGTATSVRLRAGETAELQPDRCPPQPCGGGPGDRLGRRRRSGAAAAPATRSTARIGTRRRCAA